MIIKRMVYIFSGIILCMALIHNGAYAVDSPGIEDLVIKDAFEPGIGVAVGEIRQASGMVVVVHQGQDYGYRAATDLGLYEGDTVLTGKDGSAAFKLNDGSFISLSSGTKIIINKSLYAPKQKTRSSFLNMLVGKARFIIKKFVDARHSEFKVKTKTSVAGVRGSDFIIVVAETITEITTLEKTELEVISLADPDAKPVILNDFEKTKVHMGMRPEEAQKVRAEEIDRLMKEFKFLPTDQSPIEQTFAASSMPVSVENIHVAADDLISPKSGDMHQIADQGNALQDMFRSKTILMDEHAIGEQNTRIYEEKNEDIHNRPLPDFPGSPGNN